MKYPKYLLANNRKQYPEERIHQKNLMYARHKPGPQWEDQDDFPNFDSIRSDQSVNWSAFSIPVWVRFTNTKEYKSDYGVAAYSVFGVRNAHLYNKQLKENSSTVKHIPVDFNYSHCQFHHQNLSKKERRLFRITLKHHCKPLIYPKTRYRKINLFFGLFVMLKHRLLVGFSKN